MDELPQGIHALLEPAALDSLNRSLAALVEGRQAGVAVSDIAGSLMVSVLYPALDVRACM